MSRRCVVSWNRGSIYDANIVAMETTLDNIYASHIGVMGKVIVIKSARKDHPDAKIYFIKPENLIEIEMWVKDEGT